MALELVWTAYGRAAAVALRDAVSAAKGGEPLAPVTVVVPSNHVGVASRRLLSSGTLGPVAGAGIGLAAVTFLTTYRLGELLAAPVLAGQGKRPVSTPVLAAAMRAELAADPGLFAPVAEHPATESALVATYRELRDLSPGALDALAASSARAGEVVRLHRAVRARLEAAWSDEEDLLTAAAGSVRSAVAAELGALVVHLPQRLSRHSARLLVALAEHVPTTVVAACSGVPEADAEVLASLRRLGVDGDGAAGTGDPAPVAPERTTVLTASDGDEEVRAAVRAVVDAVRSGTRLDRIAVLHASPEPYARLTHEQLHAAGIATNGAAVVPLAARVAGRTLLELLRLPAGGYRRQDVFAWLASAPILHEGRLAPTTGWERLSRDAAVVAGRADWDIRLTQHALQSDERAAEARLDDEEPDWKVPRLEAEAKRARALHRFVLEVIDDLAAAAARPRRWSEHAEWAQRWLVRLLGGAGHREAWDELGEHKAAERVEQALLRLGALDAVEGPVTLDVFHRTLELELEADLAPRRPLRRGRPRRLGRDGHRPRPRPRGGARPGRGLLPRHRARRLAAARPRAGAHGRRAGPARPTASSASTATCSAPSPVPTTSCSASPAATCAAASERVPSRWVLDLCTELRRRPRRRGGGHRTCSAPARRGCATSPPSTPGCASSRCPPPPRSTACAACSPPAAR